MIDTAPRHAQRHEHSSHWPEYWICPDRIALPDTFGPAIGTVTLLDDTHNASQASFNASIGWAKAQPAEEKVLLTSGLIELGEEEDRVHAQLGVEAAGIFARVIFCHPRHAHSFARGYGKSVEILSKKTQPVLPGSLFVCVGRIPEETVRRLLPHSPSPSPSPNPNPSPHPQS